MVKRLLVLGCLFILAIQAIVQVNLASADSPTTDEAVHLSAGYTYLTRGDWRFNPEHPPLAKVLAALPLLVIKPNISPQMEQNWKNSNNFFYDSWHENRAFGEAMMYESGNNPDQLIFYGRLPMILLTLLLGLTIFWITFKYWGAEAALVATAFYAFNPLVNGHGHLITTDIAVSLGVLLSAYNFWRLTEEPSWQNSLWLGLAFGFALLTKHTAIILVPFFIIYAIGRWSLMKDWRNWRSVAVKFIGSMVVVCVIIWAGFGFHASRLPSTDSPSSATKVINNLTTNSSIAADPKLDRVYRLSRPVLNILPGEYIKGLFMVIGHAGGGHSSFLLGENSRTGWWYYFPVLILFKTPIALLLATIGSIWLIFRKRPPAQLALSFLLAAGVFLLIAMKAKANLGLRHIMPIVPPLAIISGLASTLNQTHRQLARIVVLVLAVSFIYSYPTYLGYYNRLAGKSSDNYQIATDSNLDWGQDMKRIRRYIDKNKLTDVYIEYDWLGKPALDYYLGKNTYQPLDQYRSGQTGTAIISATAYNNPEFAFVTPCISKQLITNGVFVCQLGL